MDIIKRLTAATQMQSPRSSSCGDDNDHEQYSMLGSPFRERECSYWDPFDYKVLPKVISPRIRGRQAFTDLLMQLERDRQREIDTLAERRAVSRFTQRGRIQVKYLIHLLELLFGLYNIVINLFLTIRKHKFTLYYACL